MKKTILDFSTKQLNVWMKDNKKDERFMTYSDKISISEQTKQKIDKIIQEDKIRYNS